MPVFAAFAGENGAGVAAAHGDDDVGGSYGVCGEAFGMFGGFGECFFDVAAYLRGAERPEQGHGLVGRERDVPCRHTVLSESAAELLAGSRVLSVEQTRQSFSTHCCRQSEGGGAVSCPLAGGGTSTQVVVLPRCDLSNFAEVIVLASLGETQHDKPRKPAGECGRNCVASACAADSRFPRRVLDMDGSRWGVGSHRRSRTCRWTYEPRGSGSSPLGRFGWVGAGGIFGGHPV